MVLTNLTGGELCRAGGLLDYVIACKRRVIARKMERKQRKERRREGERKRSPPSFTFLFFCSRPNKTLATQASVPQSLMSWVKLKPWSVYQTESIQIGYWDHALYGYWSQLIYSYGLWAALDPFQYPFPFPCSLAVSWANKFSFH